MFPSQPIYVNARGHSIGRAPVSGNHHPVCLVRTTQNQRCNWVTAVALGLDQQRFVECRSSGRAQSVVEASRDDAIASGLEGTPALFLNGKRIGGMIGYEQLSKKIRDAL